LTAYVNFALESAFPRSQKVFDENRRRVLEATVVQLRELDDADARAKETEENAKLFPSSIPDLKDAMVAAQLQATESQRKTLLGVYQSLTGKPYKGKGSKPSNKSSEKKSGLGLVDDAEESNDDAPVDAPIDELTLVDVRQGDYSPLMGIQFAESGGYGGYSGFWVSPGPTQGIAGTITVLKGKNHRVNQQGNLDSWRYDPNSVPVMGLDAGSYCKRALHVSGRWITGIGAGLAFVGGSWLSYGFTSPNVTSLFSLLFGTTVGVGAEAAVMALAPGYKVSVALTPKRLLIEYGPLLGLFGGYYAGVGADIIYEFDPPACPENHQDKILQK